MKHIFKCFYQTLPKSAWWKWIELFTNWNTKWQLLFLLWWKLLKSKHFKILQCDSSQFWSKLPTNLGGPLTYINFDICHSYGLHGKKGSQMKSYVYIYLTVMQPILTNSIVPFKSLLFLYRSISTMDVPFLMLWLFQRLLNIKANTHTSYSTGCFYKRFHRWSLEPLSLTVMTTQMSMVNEIWLISLDDSLSLKAEYAFETMSAKSIWKS